MNKKIIAMILTTIMMLLSACGSNNNTAPSGVEGVAEDSTIANVKGVQWDWIFRC